MNITIVKQDCVGCSACAQACPKQCIEMKADKEGFLYPNVNKEQCINCGVCINICPSRNSEDEKIVISAYAAVNTNLAKRMNSSSGGIFPLLAEKMIDNGGIVYGAAMSDGCKELDHIRVETKEDLTKLYGSKYLQSNIKDTYSQIEEDLITGQKVLFSGTPCQVNGLKRYLRKEYTSLWTLDIFCHGVPSPLLWKKYIESQEKKYDSEVINVNFRDKKYGWKNYGLHIIDNKGHDIFKLLTDDPYMYMFLHNYSLRKSCYSCPAKGYRLSDITLGDFWGINQIFPDMNDKKGVSALIIRTEKGSQLLDSLRSNMILKEVDYDVITQYNPAEVTSVKMPKKREEFFIDVNNLTFIQLQKKYVSKTIKQRIRNGLILSRLYEN